MPLIATHTLNPNEVLPQHTQIYNGLDCCVTLEVFHELRQTVSPSSKLTYDFERALQGPALEMMLRGFKVDPTDRKAAIAYLRSMLYGPRPDNEPSLYETLNEFAHAIWDKPLNPRSHVQLKDFFYKHMRLPEIWTSNKGQKVLSMNRETLEKLSNYFHAQPIINCILTIRDYAKQLEIVETEVDPDGRMRTSYNIAGPETFRWSSSKSAEGTGGNMQNIKKDPDDLEHSATKSIRRMFVADPNMLLIGIDLEQAESREVGWQCGTLFNDWTYLDACESGDLHTLTCRMIWPDLLWTGEPKADRKIADAKFYREFSYRDMSKRGGHGSNYLGTPFTMARHLKVPTPLMDRFQERYFAAFPAIPKWHRHIAEQLQTKQCLTNHFGMTRYFYGRPNDDTTLREAVAFIPQSSTAVRLNLGLYRIWKWLHAEKLGYLTAQVHDAVYFQIAQCDDTTRAHIIRKALELVEVELFHNSRRYIVPGEAKIGWNWGNYHPTINPNGLRKFKGDDTRVRLEGIERIM